MRRSFTDGLDDLTSVQQGSQSRTFLYDGLKRLKQASNPESGTINYVYDDDSNLQQKTDARGVITTFSYDALNRLKGKSYSNDPQSTPAVTYIYDAQALPTGAPAYTRSYTTGRLVAVTYGGTSSGSYLSYDALGRVSWSTQQTDSQNYTFSTYSYDLAGALTSQTYPSGRIVQSEYDTAGRVAGVKDQATGAYWAGAAPTDAANRIQYAPQGAVAAMKLGNAKWEHTSFNSRLQPTQIGLGTSSADSSLLKLDYSYGTSSSSNNGNVATQTITIGATVMSQSYGYDGLNRLASAGESGGWMQTYDYDRYGNRAVRVGSYMPNAQLTPQSAIAGDLSAFNGGNNRVQASQYDLAGNQSVDAAGRTFSYDGENRQVSINGGMLGQYVYDGDGRRVKKVDGSGTTVFVYDGMGKLVAEYTSAAATGSGTSYVTADSLGSTRIVTKADGSVKARYDYLPFGEELGAGVGPRTSGMGYSASDNTRQKFTAKQRDLESGLDYFLARYYSSAQGRFTSPDEFAGGPHDLFVLGGGHEEKQALP